MLENLHAGAECPFKNFRGNDFLRRAGGDDMVIDTHKMRQVGSHAIEVMRGEDDRHPILM